ncbi:MAG: tetratricopeptide repeat protein [Planctomycetales bacterium]|nr:tetratricopeptide repeat protein [Planctomycetales bacterium]
MKMIPLLAVVLAWEIARIETVAATDSPADKLVASHRHLQKGRYGEAVEVLEGLTTKEAAELDRAALVKVRCEAWLSQGNRDAAENALQEAIKAEEGSAELFGLLARVHFERGRLDDADAAVAKALKLDANQLQARLIQAHLWTERGDIEKADVGYRWFVRYYNGRQPTEAEPLLFVGDGAAQYARWHSVSQIFDFCVNTVAKDALKADKECWQAHLLAGRLLLEKYNRQQGIPELKAALAINPNAVEVHVQLAQSAVGEYNWDEVEDEAKRALEIAPKTPGALRALAEAKLYFRDTEAAEKLLTEALEINPVDQQTLALVATLRMLQDGWPDVARLKVLLDNLDRIVTLKPEDLPVGRALLPVLDQARDGKKSPKGEATSPKDETAEERTGKSAHPTKLSRFEQIVVEVATRNPKPGYFLTALGEQVDRFRQHALAEPLFKQAIVLMPQLSQPKTALGQVYMQTGRIEDAKRVFDDAFKSDPYHVRVSNMRKVLKVLDDYNTVTTEHFVIRADAKLDKLLARYMAEYLEEVYPELTALFGFEPESRTQIEIYNEAKGLNGHQWFSARMVGLPWVQTIGASTGSIIAMTSPSGMDHPLNWARVMKHEFVHVLTLQQTNFNIPHWYTEALAVRSEGYPRPVEWNKLLLDRVPKGELKNLDNLSMGFIRAGNQENWNFAYCQSVLYAEYMVERFGEPSLAKLLDAYRRNRTTDQAVPEVFGVEKADFEKGYRDFLNKLVAGLKQNESEPEMKPSQIEKVYEKNKDDPKAAADYARLLLFVRERDKARKIAIEVLKRDPTQPVAALVVGALLLRDDKPDEAAKVMEPALNKEHPNRHLLELFLRVRLKQKLPDEAFALCELGQQHFPDNSDWWKGTATAAKLTGNKARRREALEKLVYLEADDPAPRKALSEMALAEVNFDESFKYAKLTLHIDVLDADIHRLLGESLRGLKQYPRAIAEFETALELKPKDPDLQIHLAETFLLSDRKDDAQNLVKEVLKQKPDHEGAKKLNENLK